MMMVGCRSITPRGCLGTPHSHLISSSGPGRSATSDHMQSHIITIFVIIIMFIIIIITHPDDNDDYVENEDNDENEEN